MVRWAVLNSNGTLQTRNLDGNGTDQQLGRVDQAGASNPNCVYWLLLDRLGSTRDVLDGSGALVDALAYDGFGKIKAGEIDSTYRGGYAWTGREIDVETDLQWNHARWYDAKIGKWISQDPLGLDAGDNNLYRYVNNRATYATDPSGLQEGVALGMAVGGDRVMTKRRKLEGMQLSIQLNYNKQKYTQKEVMEMEDILAKSCEFAFRQCIRARNSLRFYDEYCDIPNMWQREYVQNNKDFYLKALQRIADAASMNEPLVFIIHNPGDKSEGHLGTRLGLVPPLKSDPIYVWKSFFTDEALKPNNGHGHGMVHELGRRYGYIGDQDNQKKLRAYPKTPAAR